MSEHYESSRTGTRGFLLLITLLTREYCNLKLGQSDLYLATYRKVHNTVYNTKILLSQCTDSIVFPGSTSKDFKCKF